MTPSKKSFTHEYIKGLKIEEKEYTVYDAKQIGLSCRVAMTGKKTFQVYLKRNGKIIRKALGTYGSITPERARDLAKKIVNEIDFGKFKTATEKRSEESQILSVKDLFEKYLDKHGRLYTKESTVIENEGYFERNLKKWADRKITDITRDDLENLIKKLNSSAGPFTANRVLTLVRHMYNKAIEWRDATFNPTLGIRKFKTKSRERFLQPNEIKDFFTAIDQEPDVVARSYFYMALYTGQRKNNVLAMRWDQIDHVNKLWHIPETKNGEPLTVPLIPQAVERLEALKQDLQNKITGMLDKETLALKKKAPTTDFQKQEAEERHQRIQEYIKRSKIWVFPSEKGETGHFMDPKKFWKRILLRAGIEDMRIHDIRRTLGSYEAIAGVNLPTISKSLGHRTMRSTQVYARLNVNPVRNAMSKAISMIEDIREGKSE